MRRLAAVLLLGIGLGVAPAFAQDNIAVADWNAFCFSTRANTDVALQRAEEAGFEALPDGSGRALKSGKDQRTLTIQSPGATTTARRPSSCSASHKPGQGNLAAAMQALLGHPPAYTDRGFDVWMFDNVDGQLTLQTNDTIERAREAAAAGRTVLVRAGSITAPDQGSVPTLLDIVMYEYFAR